jgi:hypothetical protein
MESGKKFSQLESRYYIINVLASWKNDESSGLKREGSSP